MKDTEKTDFGAEVCGVGGNFDQSVGTGAEEQAVDHFFVLQCQRRQLMGEGEDDMSIGCGKQFRASRGQPTIASVVLTLWAVPVAAGIIGDGTMTAAGALVQMATHRGGATSHDGKQYLPVQPGEPGRRLIQESVARCGYEIRQLQQWPVHLFIAVAVFRIRLRGERERVEGTCRGIEMPLRKVQVPAGGLQIGMAEQELNGVQVCTGFEQMGSEAVPESVRVDAFVDFRPFGGLLHSVKHAPGIDGDVGVRMGAFAGKQISFWLGIG